jgi:hypothetical protein
MQAAVLEKPIATGALDADRLRAIVLVRIASAGRGVTKAELADDLAPLIRASDSRSALARTARSGGRCAGRLRA